MTSEIGAFNFSDLNSLQTLKHKAKNPDDETLRTAAQQMEAVFLNMVFKSMREANKSFESGMFESQAMGFYQDFHDQQMALHLSQGQGIGLADVIVQQLKPMVDKHKSPIDVAKTPISTLENSELKSQTKQNFETPQEFISQLIPLAQKAAKAVGINPKYLLAQAALETGWGKHIIQDEKGQSSHNLFNIKAVNWEGDAITVPTLEFNDSHMVKKDEPFRKYDNFTQSFDDFIQLLDSPRYAQVWENISNPQGFFNSLQASGYATDPNYSDKLLEVFNSSVFEQLK